MFKNPIDDFQKACDITIIPGITNQNNKVVESNVVRCEVVIIDQSFRDAAIQGHWRGAPSESAVAA